MTVIEALICCGASNFIKIGSRVRPPDAHDCRMFNAPLLNNGRCHGNRIMPDISGTWWNVTKPKLRPSRSTGRRVMSFRIFSNMAAVRHFEFLKILRILIFNHVTVVLVLTCCCVPNFIKIGSRVRPPDAHNFRMFNSPLLGYASRHGNQIVGDMSGTWWDVTTQVRSQSVHW